MDMDKRELLGLILVLLATVGTIGAVAAYKYTGESKLVVLEANAPEYGNWNPQTLYVNQGEEITLLIRNVDVVTHGFMLPELDIHKNEIKAGEVISVVMTFDKKGEFPFLCASWCSDYHMQMRGIIVVK